MVYNILLKTFRLQQLPTGQVSVLCAPRGTSHYIHNNAIITVSIYFIFAAPPARRHSFDIKQMSQKGDGQLNQEINYYLPPLHLTRNLSTPGIMGGRQPRPCSATNERAKRGFKFWIDDQAKPLNGVKTTMGSRGSFLGLGVPRL